MVKFHDHVYKKVTTFLGSYVRHVSVHMQDRWRTLSCPLRYMVYFLYILEVSDCDILRHHDSRIMTYHDCENYHDCHTLQIFGTNKQAVMYKIPSNTCHCIIPMVVESHNTHYKCYWSIFKQGNIQLKYKS